MDFKYFGFNWTTLMEGRKLHPSFSYMYYDGVNTIRVNQEGDLELGIKYLPAVITDYQGTFESTYAVATMRTKEKLKQGYLEAEIKLPRGKRLWPAFWLTGAGSWPPEIDILEAWSENRGNYFRLTQPQPPYLVPGWRVTTNYHYKDWTAPDSQKQAIGSRQISIFKMWRSPDENFHKYGVYFDDNEIRFYVDGKLLRKTDVYKQCIAPFNIVLNVWCEQYSPIITSPMIVKNLKFEGEQE